MGVFESRQLKQLKTRLSKAVADVDQIKAELKYVQERYDNSKRQLRAIENEIKSFKTKGPVVTEHALLRYIERVMGVDLDQIKNEIMNETTLRCMATISSGKIPIHPGVLAVVKNMEVITIEIKK